MIRTIYARTTYGVRHLDALAIALRREGCYAAVVEDHVETDAHPITAQAAWGGGFRNHFQFGTVGENGRTHCPNCGEVVAVEAITPGNEQANYRCQCA